MQYRSFGRTGVKVSALCLGCGMFGHKGTSEESYDVVDRAIDAGINFFDTANVYTRGRSEEVLGEALKRNGKRDRLVIATKVHGRMADDDPNAAGISRRHIIEQCEASLKRLQIDYIDLYQLHRPMPDTAIDETLRALDDLIHAGKVRYIGTSTFAAWQIMESLWMSKELGLNRFASEQPPYNILERRIERELVPMARTYGLAIMPWSPLAEGILTGKYRRNEAPPADSRLSGAVHGPRLKGLLTDKVFDVLEGLEPLAEKKGCTMSQLALAWSLSRPGITCPIIGPYSVAQLNDNLGALDIALDKEDHKRIDELVAPGTMAIPYYEAEWGPHLYR